MLRLISVLSMFVMASAVAATSSCASSAGAVRAGDVNAAAMAAGTPVIKPGDSTCLRDTGSLIRAKQGECLPVTGRSYSRDELLRTGTQDTARGLQVLDPSISVGH